MHGVLEHSHLSNSIRKSDYVRRQVEEVPGETTGEFRQSSAADARGVARLW